MVQGQEKEMSFFDHLEALRWSIIRSLAAIFIFAAIAFIFKNFVFDKVLFGPTNTDFPTYQFLCWLGEKYNLAEAICVQSINYEIINLELAGQFMVHLKTSLAIGLVFAFPYLILEIWFFIRPGLHQAEIEASRFMIFSSSFLFFIGVLFSYFVLIPFSINFFAQYSVSETIQNTFSLTNYIDFLTMFVIVSGMMFQLPILVYLLAKIGLVSAEMMRQFRKHALVVIMVISAIITPADIGTLIIVAIPLYLLYELSIFIAQRVYKPV